MRKLQDKIDEVIDEVLLDVKESCLTIKEILDNLYRMCKRDSSDMLFRGVMFELMESIISVGVKEWLKDNGIEMKLYRELTDEEAKCAIREILRTSRSEDEVKEKIRDGLGYPYIIPITATRYKSMIMFMVMVHGPSGKTLSV